MEDEADDSLSEQSVRQVKKPISDIPSLCIPDQDQRKSLFANQSWRKLKKTLMKQCDEDLFDPRPSKKSKWCLSECYPEELVRSASAWSEALEQVNKKKLDEMLTQRHKNNCI